MQHRSMFVAKRMYNQQPIRYAGAGRRVNAPTLCIADTVCIGITYIYTPNDHDEDQRQLSF